MLSSIKMMAAIYAYFDMHFSEGNAHIRLHVYSISANKTENNL